MSKVLVDRELLERLQLDAALLKCEHWRSQQEIRAILAQPAEAEGVEVVGVIDEADEGCFVELMDDRSFRLGEKLVRQSDHLAAMSAVTAERDRLRKANASRSDKLNEAQSIIDQLRAEVEALKADAERYRWTSIEGNWVARVFGKWRAHTGEYGDAQPTEWFPSRGEAIDAAMAAKEE